LSDLVGEEPQVEIQLKFAFRIRLLLQ